MAGLLDKVLGAVGIPKIAKYIAYAIAAAIASVVTIAPDILDKFVDSSTAIIVALLSTVFGVGIEVHQIMKNGRDHR